MGSAAYTAGRLGYASSPWSDRAYWLGQALIIAPIAVKLLGRRSLTINATATLIVALTTAEYLLQVCYSPTGFTFADELLHWRSTVNLMQTGQLFTVNYALPIGPHYPGLEEATSAFISVTGASVFTAGLIISGVAHLLFVCFLYMIYRGLSRSHRIAGIAVLIYSCTPDLNSFNSMFVYETFALAFLGFTVLAAWRMSTSRTMKDRTIWFVIASAGALATIVTHHITSYVLVATLILLSITNVLTKHRREAAALAALAIISAGAIVYWVLFIAPETLNYFRPTVEGFIQGFNTLLGGGPSHSPPTTVGPLGNQVLQGLAILIISALLPIGWWQVWRNYRNNAWILAMAIGSLGWFGDLVIRVTTPDGQELAGRTATFVYIPVGLVGAFAVIKLVNAALERKWESIPIAVAVAGTLTLLFDGIANGWPPYWERLPGPHQVAGFERSVGPEEIATAFWTSTLLGRGNRFASDVGIYPVLAGYGYQNPLRDVGYLYTSPEFTLPIAQRARVQRVRYVLVDRRLSQSLPASGTYFPGEIYSSAHPIPLANLNRFNNLPGVARIYDSGDIVIYDLQGLRDTS